MSKSIIAIITSLFASSCGNTPQSDELRIDQSSDTVVTSIETVDFSKLDKVNDVVIPQEGTLTFRGKIHGSVGVWYQLVYDTLAFEVVVDSRKSVSKNNKMRGGDEEVRTICLKPKKKGIFYITEQNGYRKEVRSEKMRVVTVVDSPYKMQASDANKELTIPKGMSIQFVGVEHGSVDLHTELNYDKEAFKREYKAIYDNPEKVFGDTPQCGGDRETTYETLTAQKSGTYTIEYKELLHGRVFNSFNYKVRVL